MKKHLTYWRVTGYSFILLLIAGFLISVLGSDVEASMNRCWNLGSLYGMVFFTSLIFKYTLWLAIKGVYHGLRRR